MFHVSNENKDEVVSFEIMHVRPTDADLRLGDLSYNQFQIKIRDVSARKHIVRSDLSLFFS